MSSPEVFFGPRPHLRINMYVCIHGKLSLVHSHRYAQQIVTDLEASIRTDVVGAGITTATHGDTIVLDCAY